MAGQTKQPKIKATKGHHGYLKRRKTILLLRAAALLLGIGGIVLIGYLMTHTVKNWLSIFAALTAIPLAMQLATFFSIVKFRSRPDEEYDRVLAVTKNGVLDTELLVANKDGIAFSLDYAYVHETGIYVYTSDQKLKPDKTATYIRNYLRLNDCDMNLSIEQDFDRYLYKIGLLAPGDRETASELVLQAEGVLRAISM